MADLIIGCRWCRAKTFFSQNELLLEPRELGYTLYTLVRLWSLEVVWEVVIGGCDYLYIVVNEARFGTSFLQTTLFHASTKDCL